MNEKDILKYLSKEYQTIEEIVKHIQSSNDSKNVDLKTKNSRVGSALWE